jgi:hypothetical protein
MLKLHANTVPPQTHRHSHRLPPIYRSTVSAPKVCPVRSALTLMDGLPLAPMLQTIPRAKLILKQVHADAEARRLAADAAAVVDEATLLIEVW